MNPESHTKTKLALYRRGSVAPLRRLIGELDVRQEMTRDIDIIIEKVREHLPTAAVNQLMVVNPTDDDGIWWFSLPDVERDVHVESSFGNCPFLIETTEQSSEEALRASSVDQAVQQIVEYLTAASKQLAPIILTAEPYWP
jgi:hypothetical protein